MIIKDCTHDEEEAAGEDEPEKENLSEKEAKENIATEVGSQPANSNNNPPSKEYDEWELPTREPTYDEKKKMFSEALGIVVMILMKNHLYKFGGEIYIQSYVGSIGDRATGVIAEMIIRWWIRKLKKKLNDLMIICHMLEIYVDDFNGVFDEL